MRHNPSYKFRKLHLAIVNAFGPISKLNHKSWRFVYFEVLFYYIRYIFILLLASECKEYFIAEVRGQSAINSGRSVFLRYEIDFSDAFLSTKLLVIRHTRKVFAEIWNVLSNPAFQRLNRHLVGRVLYHASFHCFASVRIDLVLRRFGKVEPRLKLVVSGAQILSV